MKILSISNCPPLEYQGSGYIIVNFCRGLQQRGHEVDLFGPDSYEPFQFIRGRGNSYRQAIGMLFFTLRQITNKKYDVVEFYGGESWLIASILRLIPNRNFLIVSHSNGLETHSYEVMSNDSALRTSGSEERKWYQLNQTPLFEKAFTQVDGIITLSDYDRNYALKHRYNNENHIFTIEPCLLNDYLNLNVDFRRQTIIGYCGTWLARKGTCAIKTDISKLLIEFPNSIFKLIGVGTNFNKEYYFPNEVCSRIEVIPFVNSKEKLRNLYQTLSIMIMPSIYESFGLVAAEAMACGCAVVAGKTGFGASLKHREEALLLDEASSPYLYTAVKELLLNEPLRLKIAHAGYQRVQNLRWDFAVEKLENTYLKWMKEL